MNKLLILASASPRRKILLKNMNIRFKALSPKIDEEEIIKNKKIFFKKHLAALIALKKAEKIAYSLKNKKNYWILAADTIIQFKNKLIGKPKNVKEAYQILKMLSGKTHLVHTGFALMLPHLSKPILKICTTKVKFRLLSEKNIYNYLKTNEWQGAAGAYRIQAQGAILIDQIKGSFTNVIGLPVEKIYFLLQKNGFFS